MFKFKVLIFTALVIGMISLAVHNFGRITQSDVEAYQKLMALNDTSSDNYRARQERENVSKQILFSEGQGRLQLIVRSNSSILQLDHEDEDTEIVEYFKNVKCYMQEELYAVLPDGREVIKQADGRYLVRNGDPAESKSWLPADTKNLTKKQVIRYLEAAQAQYHYSTELFAADDVKISRYVMPGHQLVDNVKGLKPLMSGAAKNVEFSLGNQGFNFKAQGFKGSFLPTRRSL